ncbi:MAG: Ig-like domain-containing protein, partial [Clostridia bacterium]|nr:Ig-like domain-containing protein [Clostridia bacterium]
ENGVETKTVYVAIPLVGFNMEEDMNELGRVEIKITAEKDGEAIDGTLNASRQLTENVLLQINGGAEKITLNAGETAALDVLEYPFDPLKRLSYEIEDGTVAAITQDGCITGLTAGTTVITVKDVEQPRLTKQLNVTVTGHTHDLTLVPAKDPTKTEAGNKAYYTCSECDKWFEDAAGTVEITDKTGVIIPAVGTSHTEYEITKGADVEWTKRSEKDVVITVKRSNADDTCFDHFTGVLIDKKPLEKNVDYTAAKGSVVITLRAATLEKLSVGGHTVAVDFDDGKAETKLTVKAASHDDPMSPQTGDNSHLGLWITLMMLSLFGIAATLFIGKKKRVFDRQDK